MSIQPTYSKQLSNQELIGRLLTEYPNYTKHQLLLINIQQQQLYIVNTVTLFSRTYTISSAANGTGNKNGTGRTPLGAHYIRDKFGDSAHLGSIFKGRQEIGKSAEILTGADEQSQADNITTRIMWLSGLEKGINQGGDVDSYNRYIYIHGTDEEGRLGTPASHGCIRMNNQSIIDLYKIIPLDTLVYIFPS